MGVTLFPWGGLVFSVEPHPMSFQFRVPVPVALGVIDKRHRYAPSPSSGSRMHMVSMDPISVYLSGTTSYGLIALKMNVKSSNSSYIPLSSYPHLHHQTGFAARPT